MLITVLSTQPQSSLDNLKHISDINVYKNIIRSSLELSQNRQYLKNSDKLFYSTKFVDKSNEYEKFTIFSSDSFSLSRETFELYKIKLDNMHAISLGRNDVWRHAVF